MVRPFLVCSVALLAACVARSPCERFADYVCACHADDTGFDCEALRRATERADPAVQRSCSLELAAQRQADAEAGLDCDV